MTYTEAKEREHRFTLALRMGLPIFFLSALTLFILLNKGTESMFESFVLLSITLLAVMVYFIFYLIYQSAHENITDPVTHTFTPEYFLKHLDKTRRNRLVSIMMITVKNLSIINQQYGVKNGDTVLRECLKQINSFFALKKLDKLPVCRFKGGDFLIYFEGEKENYLPLLELFLAKFQDTLMNEIEVHYEAVILDTRLQMSSEEIIVRLYELLEYQREEKSSYGSDEVEPGELEKQILSALESKRYSIAFQPITTDGEEMYESSIKLLDENGGLIHQNRFVPYLNRAGKMRELESDLLKYIIRLSVRYDGYFVLNVSSVTLRNGLFFQFALELLQRYPESKGRIVLMFEEKEYCHQVKRFKEQITQYRAVGYKIALDRFGGYHTTMMYLKEFQADFVRFDPLFTRHIKETNYQNIIQGLNIMAHLSGAQTWIAMIEDEEGKKIAEGLKINCLQGNFIAKITKLKENIKVEI